MVLHKTCKYLGYQTNYLFFWLPTWRCTLWVFLLLPYKIHADVINDLKYRGAKMATKSDMFLKYGHIAYQEKMLNRYLDWKWLGSSGFQDLLGTKKIRLLNICPELWVLSSPGTTWYICSFYHVNLIANRFLALRNFWHKLHMFKDILEFWVENKKKCFDNMVSNLGNNGIICL